MAGDDMSGGAAPEPQRGWRGLRPSGLAAVMAGLLYGLAGAILLAEVRVGDGHGIALALVLLVGGWSTALLIDALAGRTSGNAPAMAAVRRRAPVLSIAVTVIAWWVIVPALRAVWLHLGLPIDLVGNFERVLLAPVVALAFLGIARGLGLHRGVTAVAIVLVILGVFRAPVQSDWPTELVAVAGPTELAAALRDDTPIALATARQDRGTPVAPIPTKPGMRCQRVEVRDERRTLIGASAGRTEITSDTCWEADGTPFAVRVIASTDAGDTEATPLAVQVLAADPFRIAYGNVATVQPVDTRPAPGAQSRFGLRPFDPDGRVRLGSNGGNPPVLARVGRRGREVELLLGWVRADPIRGGNSALGPSAGQTGPGRVIDLTTAPGRNEVVDVFGVTGWFAGGADARFVRVTRDDREPLAMTTSDTGTKPVAAGGQRERVVLQGGR